MLQVIYWPWHWPHFPHCWVSVRWAVLAGCRLVHEMGQWGACCGAALSCSIENSAAAVGAGDGPCVLLLLFILEMSLTAPHCSAIPTSLLSVLTLLLVQAGLYSYLSQAPSPSKPALSCFGRAARTARTCVEPLPVQGDFMNAHFPSLRVSQGL